MSARVIHLIAAAVLSCCAWAIYAAEPGFPRWAMVGVSVFECVAAFVVLGGVRLFEDWQRTPEAHDLRLTQLKTKKASDAKKPIRMGVRY